MSDIDLETDTFKVALYQGTGNVTDLTMENITDLTGEVVAGTGYNLGGQLLNNVIWDVGGTPSEMRFSADPAIWNAVGGDIVGVQYAVVWVVTKQYLLFVAALEENHPINIADGNPLLLQFTNEGIFELN
jgi:hypothetical protein